MGQPHSRWALWAPVVLYLALIFGLSSLADPPELPEGSDKNLHALLYSGLGLLLVRALAGGVDRPIRPRVVLAAIIFSALYGVTDELHQYFVPPRQVEALDVVADTIGAAIAAVALYAWGIIRNRHDLRNPSGRT